MAPTYLHKVPTPSDDNLHRNEIIGLLTGVLGFILILAGILTLKLAILRRRLRRAKSAANGGSSTEVLEPEENAKSRGSSTTMLKPPEAHVRGYDAYRDEDAAWH